MYNQNVARLITEKLFNLNSCHTHFRFLVEVSKMYQTEKIYKFGGINKLKDAIQTKLLDDVYCWETEKWYTQRY